jgi:membrane protease YdiL (CAAX protease family)
MEETLIPLQELVSAFLTGCFLILFTSLIAWKTGFYQFPQGLISESEPPLPLKYVIIPFAIFILLSTIIIPILFVLGMYIYDSSLILSPKMFGLVSTISILVTFIALGIFQSVISNHDRELIFGKYFGPTTSIKKTIKDISLGVLTWFVSFPVVLSAGKGVAILLNMVGLDVELTQVAVDQVRNSLSSPLLFFVLASSIVFVVPIIEEFLFRGCLQTWMKGKIGVKKAIFFTSIIFAFFHYSSAQGLGNIELIVSLFILSCFLGFIYEKQQSLFASISLHAFFNTVTVLVIALS